MVEHKVSGHTPGPWAWFGNGKTNEVYLATTHSGRRYVMGFKRWGMRGGQPTFQPAERGMVDAADLLQFAVGDKSIVGIEAARDDDSVYRYDIRGIDCADARLIAAAPDLLAALEWIADNYENVRLNHVDFRVEAKHRADSALSKARNQEPGV